jgi:hypothetical protein
MARVRREGEENDQANEQGAGERDQRSDRAADERRDEAADERLARATAAAAGAPAAAAALTESVEGSEIIEPIRVTEKGKVNLGHLIFRNPTDRNVFIDMPERMKIPPGKSFRVLCEPNAPDLEATVGYHRAIHSQAPQLLCEFGADCPIHQQLSAIASEVSKAAPAREAREPAKE